MPPTIHLIRHAQGYHNLSEENESLADPDLTPLGEEQCALLRSSFTYHDKLTRLVASPLRRTIHTCRLAFGSEHLYPITLVDTLQEVSNAACDVGSSKEQLRTEFGDLIDVRGVGDSWTYKGEGSPFEPTLEALAARAKAARKTLRLLAGEGDEHIAVVTHGGFLHFLTDDWDGIPMGYATAWTNCMCRSYQFAESPDDADDIRLVETQESWLRREPESKQPLTATEQREIRAVVQKRLAPALKIKTPEIQGGS